MVSERVTHVCWVIAVGIYPPGPMRALINHLSGSEWSARILVVAAIVLLNVVSPSKLAGELELFGHQVWEALEISEVLFLCEQHAIDAVVIAAEVELGELIEKQLRGVVMRLDKTADAAYVDWELFRLFPKSDMTIQ